MTRSVQTYVHRCRACQLAKKHRTKQAGLLKPIPAAEVLAQVSMDLLDASTTTPDGNRHVIVLTDAASGFLMAVPVKNKSSQEAVRAFNSWRAVFRSPHVLLTDNGTNFVKGDLPKLLRSGAVHLKTSTPYRAQGNGRAERAVQVVRTLLSTNRVEDDRPWDRILPEVVSAYNASKHSSSQFSPHYLLFGVQPEMAIRAPDGTGHMHVVELPPTPEDRAELLEWVRAIAKNNVVKAQARQKVYFDRRRQVRRFEPGARVKLMKSPPQLAKQGKFASPFIGPLIVDECLHDDVYRLRTAEGKLVKGRGINVQYIFPYYEEDDVPVDEPTASTLSPEPSATAKPGQAMPPTDQSRADEENIDDEDDPPVAVHTEEPPQGPIAAEPSPPTPAPSEQPVMEQAPTTPTPESPAADTASGPPEPDEPEQVQEEPPVVRQPDPPQEPQPTRRYPERERRPTRRYLGEALDHFQGKILTMWRYPSRPGRRGRRGGVTTTG
jgi:outer membrane biosynthesis protein TonB